MLIHCFQYLHALLDRDGCHDLGLVSPFSGSRCFRSSFRFALNWSISALGFAVIQRNAAAIQRNAAALRIIDPQYRSVPTEHLSWRNGAPLSVFWPPLDRVVTHDGPNRPACVELVAS
jgi:hypothetical protein